MEYDHNGDLKWTTLNVITLTAYFWLFISVLGGIVTLAQYLYKHLTWV